MAIPKFTELGMFVPSDGRATSSTQKFWDDREVVWFDKAPGRTRSRGGTTTCSPFNSWARTVGDGDGLRALVLTLRAHAPSPGWGSVQQRGL